LRACVAPANEIAHIALLIIAFRIYKRLNRQKNARCIFDEKKEKINGSI